ncbi:MAG: transglutaminase domain-containing protein [Promethearchaeia archaeon]
MSLERELLEPQINKKRAAAVFLIAILLIAFFSLSTVLFNFLLGSQRINPNEKLDDADFEDVTLNMPDIPFDLEDLIDALDPEDLEDLDLTEEDIDELFQEMYDGDIDNMDLSTMGAAMAALLGSDEEVFRIFDYDNFDNLSDKLWRYECFEEYNGTSWKSSASKQIFDFYSYGDLEGSEDILRLKRAMNPSSDQNSFVAPALFPNPNIMEGSVSGDTLDESSATLYKDDYNCTTMDATFTSDQETNMSYELFGTPQPSPEDLNSSQVDESFTPSAIRDLYLQLPPSISTYRANHDDFDRHCDNLEVIIKEDDGAYTVANKIRNYLQANFTDPYSGGAEIYTDDGPAEGEDEIEWFCEKEGGLWSHFASAFTAFTRVFGVSSRYVNGFNSRALDEVSDPQEGEDAAVVRYKNLYNWAEIYVPTDTSGNGRWVEMDINFETFGSGGMTAPEGEYNITLTSNVTGPINRGNIAELNASLSSDTGDVEDKEIKFYDHNNPETPLGSAITNANGNATLLVDINDTQVVGPHNIYATYYTSYSNPITYLINDDIVVHLSRVNPQEVNRSDSNPDETTIKGNVYDPANNEGVRDADIEYVLLEKGTNNKYNSAFTPNCSQTNSTGDFEDTISVNAPPAAPYGTFDIRVDFNGTWNDGLYVSELMENSSNRIEFNHTSTHSVNFYINNTDSTNYENPTVNRTDSLHLKAKVVASDGSTIPDKDVQFINADNNSTLFTNTTNADGLATYTFDLNSSVLAGPNLLCAQVGYVTNYSYFVLEEKPTIHINSGPTPREINRTGSGIKEFSIPGSINDTNGNPIPYAEIGLRIFRNSTDFSEYLSPPDPPKVNSDGKFNFTYGVSENIPYGNYTLRMDFNGTVDRSDDSDYPHYFELSEMDNSTILTDELKVEAPDEFTMDFFIDGYSNDDFYSPNITRNDEVNLSVEIQWGMDLAKDGDIVTFRDHTQDLVIAEKELSNGQASVSYEMNDTIVAGPHLISASYDRAGAGEKNHSYFILDAPIDIDLDFVPQTINSTGNIGRNFVVRGSLKDPSNSKSVKYGQISVHMLDGNDDVSFYLNQEAGDLALNETGEIYAEFSVSESTPPKNYTIETRFNGTFLYTNSEEDYQYDYFLPEWSNFSAANESENELEVINPEELSITFKIGGEHTRPTYDNSNPPATYQKGENATFEVWVNHTTTDEGTVRLMDNYTGTELDSAEVNITEGGYHEFSINTTDLHAGLHRIIVTYEDFNTINDTYIVINESVDISSELSVEKVRRNQNGFSVEGNVTDEGEPLRALNLSINFYDSSMQDASDYFNLEGSSSIIVQEDGTYCFNISYVDLEAPQGQYYVQINFTGDIIELPDVHLTDYMVHSNSSCMTLNVTAGTTITEGDSYTLNEKEEKWYNDDILYVTGNLTWDNGSAMEGYNVNVTIEDENGNVIAFNDTVTVDSSGFFNGSLTVDSNWPTYQEDTSIKVEFNPFDEHNFDMTDGYYVEGSSQEYT